MSWPCCHYFIANPSCLFGNRPITFHSHTGCRAGLYSFPNHRQLGQVFGNNFITGLPLPYWVNLRPSINQKIVFIGPFSAHVYINCGVVIPKPAGHARLEFKVPAIFTACQATCFIQWCAMFNWWAQWMATIGSYVWLQADHGVASVCHSIWLYFGISCGRTCSIAYIFIRLRTFNCLLLCDWLISTSLCYTPLSWWMINVCSYFCDNSVLFFTCRMLILRILVLFYLLVFCATGYFWYFCRVWFWICSVKDLVFIFLKLLRIVAYWNVLHARRSTLHIALLL